MNQEFVLFDHLSSSLTDFRPERVGKWNKADPSYVPQYCAFFLLLADEKIEQTRGSDDVSIFSLFSSWGASTFFFYVVFAVLSSRWNHSRFNAQVRGLDLRDLASEQFDANCDGQGDTAVPLTIRDDFDADPAPFIGAGAGDDIIVGGTADAVDAGEGIDPRSVVEIQGRAGVARQVRRAGTGTREGDGHAGLSVAEAGARRERRTGHNRVEAGGSNVGVVLDAVKQHF